MWMCVRSFNRQHLNLCAVLLKRWTVRVSESERLIFRLLVGSFLIILGVTVWISLVKNLRPKLGCASQAALILMAADCQKGLIKSARLLISFVQAYGKCVCCIIDSTEGP
uniref:Uncharacterized protein n=1 Tax=Trypanosoma vivax (strain Y486) TaxID=1055687 RepID=G0TV74_TRYVY|nr:hypothetical protein TVY486_0500490 [Trypanosoma vivax Y486]